MDYEFSKGKVTEKLTPAKRYSYLAGMGEPSPEDYEDEWEYEEALEEAKYA